MAELENTIARLKEKKDLLVNVRSQMDTSRHIQIIEIEIILDFIFYLFK